MTKLQDKIKASVAPHITKVIDPKKIKMNDTPNVGSFTGVRTTAQAVKEGRMKVDAGATPKVKVKKVIIKKILNQYK